MLSLDKVRMGLRSTHCSDQRGVTVVTAELPHKSEGEEQNLLEVRGDVGEEVQRLLGIHGGGGLGRAAPAPGRTPRSSVEQRCRGYEGSAWSLF